MHFFAALVSGGKDSCHALAAAARAGHTPVVLLNLAPADAQADAPDVDSHCFQTVGHDALPALAAATGLPLLRRRLSGASVDTSLDYASRGDKSGDEVEDLVALLAAAVARFPHITAVVSGAVASDYQRLRVEHAAGRVGLTSLAPLWRVGQADLLADMGVRGTEAIIVKTAAAGLDAAHIGAYLASVVPLLLRLGTTMGVHPAGEGGEYETLTLDCAAFERAKLVVDTPPAATPTGGGAFVATGLTLRADVKPGWAGGAAGEVAWVDEVSAPPPAARAPRPPPSAAARAIARVRSSPAGYQVTACAPGDPARATADALTAAAAALSDAGGPPLDAAAHVRLYLPTLDGGAFGEANNGYARVMPPTAPPARACVAAPLEEGCGAAVDVCLPLPTAPRAALHVQSVSAWAPACIGPYAQAVVTDGALVRCAGQIGLDPETMVLVGGGARAQAARAWASVDAVAVAVAADARGGAVSVTLYASEDSGAAGLQAVADESGAFFAASDDDADPSAYRDPYLTRPPPPFARADLPPLIYLVSPGLPRAAAVEVEPTLWRGPRCDVTEWTDAGAGCTAVALASPHTFCSVAVETGADVAAATAAIAAALTRAALPSSSITTARCYIVRGGSLDAGDGTDAAIAAAWAGAGLQGPAPPATWVCGAGVTHAVAGGAVFDVLAVGEGGVASDSD